MTWRRRARVTITYSVTVSDPQTGDRVLVNTVTSGTPGSNCPPGGAAPACTATVTDLLPALTLTKTRRTTTTAVPGGVVGYTITVTNTGQTPYTGAAAHRPADRRARRRRLQRRRHRDHRHCLVRQPRR